MLIITEPKAKEELKKILDIIGLPGVLIYDTDTLEDLYFLDFHKGIISHNSFQNYREKEQVLKDLTKLMGREVLCTEIIYDLAKELYNDN